MENQLQENQVNPGQKDQFGNEVVIKKNEGISEQGNEWSDQEGFDKTNTGVLGEKAEKYLKESADIEDLPEEEDKDEADEVIESNTEENQADINDDSDDVIEDPDDYVPGFDLGRNKVQ